jgi:hypothetical protein
VDFRVFGFFQKRRDFFEKAFRILFGKDLDFFHGCLARFEFGGAEVREEFCNAWLLSMD